jgi:hypothetical protein
MKSIAAILALSALCSISLAQTRPDIQLPPNVRMYEPKNLTPDRAERVATFVRNLVEIQVSWDNVPHAFVIRGGKPEEQDTAEALLKRFDVPESKVELRVHLIRAWSGSSPAVTSVPANAVPADLKSAIDEMKSTFNYDRYSLWDTILIQPKGIGGETRGILPTDPSAEIPPYVYTVTYGLYGGSPAEGKTVNLSNFSFSIKIGDIESHIKTDVTLHDGQKLVLGKIRLLPGANSDLFLVLTTKID